jgi:PrtD family type I secretion system ABC transporter
VINVLYLTGSFFMLQVYDRVLPSGSIPTLAALAILATCLYVFQGVLDVIRGRILVRVGGSIDAALSRRIYEIVVRMPLYAPGRGDGLVPVRDLDQIRGFLAGSGPLAFCDLPWLPIYLAICFVFHPMIGLAALVGAFILLILTLLTEVYSRQPAAESAGLAGRRNALAEAARRNAEVLRAMGMEGLTAARYAEVNSRYMAAQRRASDVSGGLGALSKIARMLLQSAVLAVGAFLVIRQEATGGVIIAGSILSARALAPVELAIANWRGFVSARLGWRRLSATLEALPRNEEPLLLPKPMKSLSVEALSIVPPGYQRVVASDITFKLIAGQGLGIIGSSASGKSSIARALVGVWKPSHGKVRLDGASLEHWSAENLGPHIGYMPQDVELFSGTVAENIARFRPDATPDRIIEAAMRANVHELVLALPNAYETEIGEGGQALSAGQRQRIALARALYGNPFLIVLDEPNSNLDADGEAALTDAIKGARTRGGIVVVIAHRPSALAAVDTVLMMNGGRVQAFGPKDEVLTRVLKAVPPVAPVRAASEARA